MPECCSVRLRVEEQGAIALGVDDGGGYTWASSEYVPMVTNPLPTYDGPYEADARFSEQTFPTAHKAMADDFSVHAINYTEAPNDAGGLTLTIGG